MAAQPPKVDAFAIPKGFAGRGRAAWQHDQVNRQFAPLAGAKRLWISDSSAFNFAFPLVSGRIERDQQSILYPSGHPLAGEDRYEWFTASQGPDGAWRPDGKAESVGDFPGQVKFGFLKKDEVDEDDPIAVRGAEDVKRMSVENSRAMLKYVMETPEHYETLKSKLGFSDEQMEVHFGHVAR